MRENKEMFGMAVETSFAQMFGYERPSRSRRRYPEWSQSWIDLPQAINPIANPKSESNVAFFLLHVFCHSRSSGWFFFPCQGTGQLLGRARIDYLFRDVFAKLLNAKVWRWGGGDATKENDYVKIHNTLHMFVKFCYKWISMNFNCQWTMTHCKIAVWNPMRSKQFEYRQLEFLLILPYIYPFQSVVSFPPYSLHWTFCSSLGV